MVVGCGKELLRRGRRWFELVLPRALEVSGVGEDHLGVDKVIKGYDLVDTPFGRDGSEVVDFLEGGRNLPKGKGRLRNCDEYK